MPSMKCTACGISFFSPTGSDRCSRCVPKAEHAGHGSCGCGHGH